ncbi:MAG: DUF1045 domain-containing protein [Marinibacterium sp.]
MNFTRYALYFAPPETEDWSRLASAWLGWDMVAGRILPHPAADGLDVAAISDRPRKYGLHGTIKPPFRLAAGCDAAGLVAAARQVCARAAPVTLEGLEVARLGSFLALRPTGDQSALADLAATCFEALDGFRAPAPEDELAKRRAAGLSKRQEANLIRWGYPYVMDDFRFHITLSGRLDPAMLDKAQTWLTGALDPLLPRPFVVSDLALTGEAPDGRFHLIHRYTLSP